MVLLLVTTTTDARKLAFFTTPNVSTTMDTTNAQQSEDLFIQKYRFFKNETGELIKIPASPGLLGFLVIDAEEDIFYQNRLLSSSDEQACSAFSKIWDAVMDRNDSILFPEMLACGTEDDVPFYVSTLPNGEPLSRYLEGAAPLPTSVACQLMAGFIGRLRSQDILPADQFSFSTDSLWIVGQGTAPRIMFGEISAFEVEDAEARNVAVCYDILRQLCGDTSENASFQLVCQLMTDEPVTLKQMEDCLREYLDSDPVPASFWSSRTEPSPILGGLVSDREIVEEIHEPLEIESEAELELEPEDEESRVMVDRLIYFAGAAALVIAAASSFYFFGSGRSSEVEVLSKKVATEVESAGVQAELDESRAAIVNPRELSLTPMISFEVPEVPFAYAAKIDLPELANVDLALKDEVADLSQSGSVSMILDQLEQKNEVSSTAGYEKVDATPKPTALSSISGLGRSADVVRKEGEAVFYKDNATFEDLQNGFFYFLEAANLGDQEAQFLTGECLVLGKGTQKDFAKGVGYLEEAVKQGEPKAMDLLGICFVRGWGVQRDEHRAVQMFQMAVDEDHIPSYYNLGARYAQGQGVERNPVIAADLFQIGAQRDDAHCMMVYARCLETGFGRKANIKKATKWFQQAAVKKREEAIEWCDRNGVDYTKGLSLNR